MPATQSPMVPMPSGAVEQVHGETAPNPISADNDASTEDTTPADPGDAIDSVTEKQLVEIFRGDGDVSSKLKQIGDLMRKHDKIHKLLEPDESDAEREAEEDPDVQACQMSQGGKGNGKPIAATLRTQAPDPMLVRLAAENYGMKLDALVLSRKISPAVAAKLKQSYIGPNNQTLSLSLSQGAAGVKPLDSLIDALNDNTVMPDLGEHTKVQAETGKTYVLSNPAAGGTDDETQRGLDTMNKQLDKLIRK